MAILELSLLEVSGICWCMSGGSSGMVSLRDMIDCDVLFYVVEQIGVI